LVVEKVRSETRLRKALPELIDRLEGRGFQVREASCRVGDPETLRQSLVRELSGTGAYSFMTVA
jgi:hypothetical protein